MNPAFAQALMYHRIAEPGLDPWRLRVTPELFDHQLGTLKKHFDFLGIEKLAYDDGERPTLLVTFDDGYLDNLTTAKPILEKHGIPAVVFTPTGHLPLGREFWWDELEQIFLFPSQLPAELNLNPAGIDLQVDLGDAQKYSGDDADSFKGWTVRWDGTPPPTMRHRLFLDVWEKLSETDGQRRDVAMELLFEWSGSERRVRDSNQLMGVEALRDISRDGLIKIGSHTVTHPDLTKLQPDALENELRQSKSTLEDVLDQPVTALAYPHGRYNQMTARAAQEAGYTLAFAANPKPPFVTESRFAIPRLMVTNQRPEDLLKKLAQAC